LAALSLVYALVFLPVLLLMLGPVVHTVVPVDSSKAEGEEQPAGDEEDDEQQKVSPVSSGPTEQSQEPGPLPAELRLPSEVGAEEDRDPAPSSPKQQALTSKATVRPATAPLEKPHLRSRLSSQAGQKRSNSFGGVGNLPLDPGSRAQVFQAHVGGGVTPGTVGSTEVSVGGGVWVDTSVFTLASEIEEEEV